MNYRCAMRALALTTIVTATACGQAPGTPTAPTVSSFRDLLLPKVEGLWDGNMTFTSISGGTGIVANAGSLDCIGLNFKAVLGQSNDSRLQIVQDGLKVEGRLTSSETGLACSYTGSIGANGGMVLDAVSCSESPLAFRCQPDAAPNVVAADPIPVRQLDLVGSTLTANLNAPVNVTVVSGKASHTYNVLDASGNPLGGLVANHSFTLTRR